MKNIKKNEQFHLINLEENYFCFLKGNPLSGAPTTSNPPATTLKPALPATAPSLPGGVIEAGKFLGLVGLAVGGIENSLKLGDSLMGKRDSYGTGYIDGTAELSAGQKVIRGIQGIWNPNLPRSVRKLQQGEELHILRGETYIKTTKTGEMAALTSDNETIIELSNGIHLEQRSGMTFLVQKNSQGLEVAVKKLYSEIISPNVGGGYFISVQPKGKTTWNHYFLEKFMQLKGFQEVDNQITKANTNPPNNHPSTIPVINGQLIVPQGTTTSSASTTQTNGVGGTGGPNNTATGGSCSSEEELLNNDEKDKVTREAQTTEKTFQERLKIAEDAIKNLDTFKKAGASSEKILQLIKNAENAIQDLAGHPLAEEDHKCYGLAKKKIKELKEKYNFLQRTLDKLNYSTLSARNKGDGILARLKNSRYQITSGVATLFATFASIPNGWQSALGSGSITGVAFVIHPVAGVVATALMGGGNIFYKMTNPTPTPPTLTNPSATPTASTSTSATATPTASTSTSATVTPSATTSPAPVVDTTTPNLELKSDSEEAKTLLKTLVGKELPVYTFQNGTFTLTNQKITLNKTIVLETGILPAVGRKEDIYLLADTSNMLKVGADGFVLVVIKNPQIK